MAAQCTIDLALSVIARRGLGVPQSYREAFELLARANIIDAELATELQKWAGLRNVLVHVYTALDLERIHRALAQTGPLHTFQARIAGELSKG